MKPVLPVLSAPLVPLALRVLPVRREPPAQPEQKALPVPSAPPVLQGRLFMHNSNFCLVMGH